MDDTVQRESVQNEIASHDDLYKQYKRFMLGFVSVAIGIGEFIEPNSATIQLIHENLHIDNYTFAIAVIVCGLITLWRTYNNQLLNGLLLTPLNFYLITATYRILNADVGLYPAIFYSYVVIDTALLVIHDIRSRK